MFRIITIFLLIILQTFATKVDAIEEVACVTVPKSGTHLMQKLLWLLGSSTPLYHPQDFYSEKINKEKFKKCILLIRDPRDTCISWVNFVDKKLLGKMGKRAQSIDKLPEKKMKWKLLCFEDKLTYVIMGNCQETLNKINPAFNTLPLASYEMMVDLSRKPNTIICKFENLVGPQGGGSREAQEKEILKIAQFIDLEISYEKLNQVADSLFGDTYSFQKGQIGEWKTLFTEEHVNLFKSKRNHLLTHFNYEKDCDW
ncbi:MAG: sulfotransferase domain-containing protein [Chlamydiota bacterium]